jgi:hypothetical protein
MASDLSRPSPNLAYQGDGAPLSGPRSGRLHRRSVSDRCSSCLLRLSRRRVPCQGRRRQAGRERRRRTFITSGWWLRMGIVGCYGNAMFRLLRLLTVRRVACMGFLLLWDFALYSMVSETWAVATAGDPARTKQWAITLLIFCSSLLLLVFLPERQKQRPRTSVPISPSPRASLHQRVQARASRSRSRRCAVR